MNQTQVIPAMKKKTHSVPIGYALWIFGFMGAHRFYYGKPVSGTIYFCTFGILGIGWLIDLFLIPRLDAQADRRYVEGPKDYSISFILLTFLGVLGIHRFYLGKWITGVVYLLSGALLSLGLLYDFWTLNEQVNEINRQTR